MAMVAAPAAQPREAIVGGGIAAPGSWPAIVALVAPGVPDLLDAQFCSGALIDPSWVLTAGHCVSVPSGVDVVAGVTDLTTTTGSQRRSVTSIREHPTADVALLQLTTPIASQTSPPIEPMALAGATPAHPVVPGIVGKVAGWGSTVSGPTFDFPNALHETTVTVLSDPACRDWWPDFSVDAPEDLCASPATPLPSGPCVGDSGSPLTVVDATGRRVIAGLVSLGDPNSCGTPGVYADVSSPGVYDWIYQANLGYVQAGSVHNLVIDRTEAAYTAEMRWSAPASSGSFPLSGYSVEIVPPTTAAPVRTIGLPPSTTQLRISDLVPHFTPSRREYSITVRAVTAAGRGVADLRRVIPRTLGPSLTAFPTIIDRPRAGQLVTANPGAWRFYNSQPDNAATAVVSIQWEACSVGLSQCSLLPAGGPQIVLPLTTVGKVVRIVVTVRSRDAATGVFRSREQRPVPPTARVVLSPSTTDARGRAIIRAKVKTQVGTKLTVQLFDHRGRRIALDRSRSLFQGRRPTTVNPGQLRARVRGQVPPVLIVSTARSRTGPTRMGTLVLGLSIDNSDTVISRTRVALPS